MIRKIYLSKCLGLGDWAAVRADLQKRPVAGESGTGSEAELSALLARFGIHADRIELWGSGKPLREFLWSEDMAAASLYVLEHVDFADLYPEGSKEIRNCHINIGSGRELSIRELAELIARTIGYQGKLRWDSSKPDGTMRKLCSVDKLHALGWRHSVEIEEGVARLYDWYLTH